MFAGNCDSPTCYNSLYFTSSGGNCDDDDADKVAEGFTLLGVALGGVVVGMVIMWLLTSYVSFCKNNADKSMEGESMSDDLLIRK